MSLLRIRRERRAEGSGKERPPRLWSMLLGLAVVLFLIWYLGKL